jgi:ABC-type uncharacterized transport system auxiliary subunit
LDVDYALAGTIAEFRYDANTKRATITVSLDLVQVSDGTVVVSLGETGQGRATADDPNTAYIAAIADVAQKVGAAVRERLAPAPTEQPKTQKPSARRQERTAFSLFGLLILVGIRLASF